MIGSKDIVSQAFTVGNLLSCSAIASSTQVNIPVDSSGQILSSVNILFQIKSSAPASVVEVDQDGAALLVSGLPSASSNSNVVTLPIAKLGTSSFAFQIQNSAGDKSSCQSAVVAVGANTGKAPIINTFVANPISFDLGKSTQFVLGVTGDVASAAIDGSAVALTSGQGSLTSMPTVTGKSQHTASVTGSGGTTTQQISILVNPTCQLTTSSNSVAVGSDYPFHVVINGGFTSAKLTGVGISDVTVSGSTAGVTTDVSATVVSASGSQTAILSITGPDNTSSQCQVAINTQQKVVSTDPIASLFKIDPIENIAVVNTTRHLLTSIKYTDMLTNKVMNSGEVNTYIKDSAGHVIHKKNVTTTNGVSATYNVDYSYDSSGKLAKVQYYGYWTNSGTYVFDANGRIVSHEWTYTGTSYSLNGWLYWCLVAPSGGCTGGAQLYLKRLVSYVFDTNGRLTQINENDSGGGFSPAQNLQTNIDWNGLSYNNGGKNWNFMFADNSQLNIYGAKRFVPGDQAGESPILMNGFLDKSMFECIKNPPIADCHPTSGAPFSLRVMPIKIVTEGNGSRYQLLYLSKKASSSNSTVDEVVTYDSTKNLIIDTGIATNIISTGNITNTVVRAYDLNTMNLMWERDTTSATTKTDTLIEYQYEP